MDWLKAHIHEVILPNLLSDILDLTGIQLDETLGEFKVVATALDPEDETSEEYEVTIHFGELCLVDACFLLEEIEAGTLPLCQSEDELTESLIQAKLDNLRSQAIPLLRDELAEELKSRGWDPKLAHLLDMKVELVETAEGMRSSGGYPPMCLVLQHPDYDPDSFEISIRIDPMAKGDWVHWKGQMPRIEKSLRAVGEEPTGMGDEEANRDNGGGLPLLASPEAPVEIEDGPSPEDLDDPELTTMEREASDEDPAELPDGAEIPDDLAGQITAGLEASLAGDGEGESSGKPGKKGGKGAGKATAKGGSKEPAKASSKPAAAPGPETATKARSKIDKAAESKASKAPANSKASEAKAAAKAPSKPAVPANADRGKPAPTKETAKGKAPAAAKAPAKAPSKAPPAAKAPAKKAAATGKAKARR